MADTKIDTNLLPAALSTATSELSTIRPSLIENALTQALPLPDIMFGGIVLVVVIMFHAFWIRFITNTFLKRSQIIRMQMSFWRADLQFAAMVVMLLALHLAEVVVWAVALVYGDIVGDWATATYFAANCYTALGEPFSLPHAWRIIAPIIAMSGIFAFAWTASVLVNFVARYNEIRNAIQVKPGP